MDCSVQAGAQLLSLLAATLSLMQKGGIEKDLGDLDHGPESYQQQRKLLSSRRADHSNLAGVRSASGTAKAAVLTEG